MAKRKNKDQKADDNAAASVLIAAEDAFWAKLTVVERAQLRRSRIAKAKKLSDAGDFQAALYVLDTIRHEEQFTKTTDETTED